MEDASSEQLDRIESSVGKVFNNHSTRYNLHTHSINFDTVGNGHHTKLLLTDDECKALQAYLCNDKKKSVQSLIIVDFPVYPESGNYWCIYKHISTCCFVLVNIGC